VNISLGGGCGDACDQAVARGAGRAHLAGTTAAEGPQAGGAGWQPADL